MGMGVLERICMDGVPGGKLEDGCVWGGWGGGGLAQQQLSACPPAH